MMLRKPHRERAQAAQREKHVVRSRADAEQPDRLGNQRPGLGVGRNGAEHDVGMPADIFGRGLNADVDALIQRAVKQRGRPGVVVDHERAACMRDGSDRGNIGHFERLRAGRFDQYRPGVRPEQFGDACADHGIEIGGFDAVAREQSVAEISRGAVGIVADQEMIAGLQHRKQGRGDRRQTRGRNSDARALRAFERHQRLLQRLGGRGAAAAILELAAMSVQIFGGRIEHGGAVDDRGIDESFLRPGVAARGYQRGFCLLRDRSPVVFLKYSCVRRHQRPFAAAAAPIESPPGGGFGLSLLITGHRRRPSTP